MKNDHITALAREYAEFTDTSDVEKKHISAICENFLRYTLRRFCLVEKSKLREVYKDAQKDQHNSEGDFALTLAGRNRSVVLIDLFSEIAKEVEG